MEQFRRVDVLIEAVVFFVLYFTEIVSDAEAQTALPRIRHLPREI